MLIENELKILAGIMAIAPKGEAVLLVPIWKRRETELKALRDAEYVVSMAIKRAFSTSSSSQHVTA